MAAIFIKSLDMNIQSIIESGANITLAVTVADLKEFALSIFDEAKKEAKPKDDKVYDVREAANLLHVSTNTLWRWEKSGYFVPATRIGKSPRYTQSQIDTLKGMRYD